MGRWQEGDPAFSFASPSRFCLLFPPSSLAPLPPSSPGTYLDVLDVLKHSICVKPSVLVWMWVFLIV